MTPGGITEVIWHFAGYLKLINDIARDRIAYDEAAFHYPREDYTTPRPDYGARPEIDPFETRGIKFPEIPLPEEVQNPALPPLLKNFGPLPQPEFETELPLNPARFLPSPGGGAAAGIDFLMTVQYEADGEQSLIDIRQKNFLLDDDVIVVMPDGTQEVAAFAEDLAVVKSSANLAIDRMVDDANAEIPIEWWIAQNSAGLIEFIETHDAETKARDGPAPHSVEPGYYLNGDLQQPTPAPPYQTPLTEPLPEPDFGQGAGQWARAGGNGAFNAALIVDLGESGRSMIVMEDYYKTNAIFQINSLSDRDQVSTKDDGKASILSGGNVTDNIADFIQYDGLYDSVPVTFAGPRWIVDVVEGDFYNVHAVVQLNYLSDNDVVVQKSASAKYAVHSGENQLGNLTEIFNGTIHYDLIVVAGSYHGLNLIFQNNILLNSDVIELIAKGIAPVQTVASGHNELTNLASIETYGDDNFQPTTAAHGHVVEAVANGLGTLDPTLGTIFDGTGGPFEVLYVTGDYYDVNAIWQTNVISDANLILQILDPPSAELLEIHPDDTGTQSVISGENTLSNDAAIVDVGPTNTFIDGEVYGDTILVQANLLPADQAQQVTQDMNALVPELIAFVNDVESEQSKASPAVAPLAHEDPIGSMTH